MKMKKGLILAIILVLLMGMGIYAAELEITPQSVDPVREPISNSNYKTFQGYNTDFGYRAWGVNTYYDGEAVYLTNTKYVDKNYMFAYIVNVYDPAIGCGSYLLQKLEIKKGSTVANTYYSFQNSTKSRWLDPQWYVYFDKYLGGTTSIYNSESGKVVTYYGFTMGSSWIATNAWSNSLTASF
ncbi:hypothetical protein SAMN02745975_03105 [Geosporobacter subterraneus DSM 17957]|uniref:Uncharacterized protein n=1 Tax=Geosporobacter subterraneus DSM 17957 TaxID=1121919 RepID=A0A1M6MVS1_9FIRM|nr:hypothetical protein [Geosporobacter subterraneus]SHJ87516.1 hypothetical protein SAMN02745975_03105 [Geosporobacter subterraneus DSM 17957]